MTGPIKGKKILVEIPEITDNATPTPNPILVHMKQGIAEYWGLSQVPSDDPRRRGVFAGAGTNAGKTFQKRVGGSKFRSVTFIPTTNYTIKEYLFDAQDNAISVDRKLKSFTVGFPKYVTVHEVVDFVLANAKVAETAFIRSWNGVQTPIFKAPPV